MAGEKPTGSLNRHTHHTDPAGGMTPAGGLAKKIVRALAGAISSIVGGLVKKTKKAGLAGTLTLAGTIVAGLAVKLMAILRSMFFSVNKRWTGTNTGLTALPRDTGFNSGERGL